MPFTKRGWEKQAAEDRRHLQPGETAIHWTAGTCDTERMGRTTRRNGIIYATDRRILIVTRSLFGGFSLEEFPYSKMSSLEVSKGLLGYGATFYASSNKTKIFGMVHGDPAALTDYVRGKLA